MSVLSNSQQLRLKVHLALGELSAATEAFARHPGLAKLYPEYLFTVHTIIRASVPLMEAAQRRAQTMADADPVARGLAAYLTQHIKEEMHHDDWLLDDLGVMGYDRAQILARVPSATVAEMVGSQYYWIFHTHPIGLLGYIAILEGYPPTMERIEALKAATGYPAEAYRTLVKHAHLDPHHRDDLNAAIDGLPLQPDHRALLGISAMQTIHLLACALGELLDRFPVEAHAAAPQAASPTPGD